MVMISNGILNMLIKERTIPTENAGTTIINNAFKNDLNKTNSIKKIAAKTKDIVFICELNRLCNKLLYKTPKPLTA